MEPPRTWRTLAIATNEEWLRRLRMAEVLSGVVTQGHAVSLVPPCKGDAPAGFRASMQERLARERSEAFENGRREGIRVAIELARKHAPPLSDS